MVTRDDIQNEALSWKGVPWRHQGRNRHGIDCCGLAVVVAQSLGIPCEDITGYNRKVTNFRFLEEFRKRGIEVPFSNVQKGDVICFNEDSYPCHCGIAVIQYNNLYFVHAHASHRKVMCEQLQGHWKADVCAVFRYPGVE